MLDKFKFYLIGAAFLFFIALTVSNNINHKRYLRERSRADVAENNFFNSIQDNQDKSQFILRQDQVIGKIKIERDSLAKELQIRPKTITKIVERVITQTDTIIKDLPVYMIGKNEWSVSDSDKCFVWKGIAKLTDDSLNVNRTLFSYHNNITEVFYSQRDKILFLRIGKKRTYQKTLSECGGERVREIIITKP